MKLNTKEKYFKYYIKGGVISLIALILIVVGATLPLIDENSSVYGYIGLVLCIVGLLLCLLGFHFLKKGSSIKLNIEMENSKKEFEEQLEKLSYKWDKAEAKEENEEVIEAKNSKQEDKNCKNNN